MDGMLIYLSTDDVKRRTFIEGDGGHCCFPSSRPGHAFNTLKEYMITSVISMSIFWRVFV